jgi:alkanesulfonate monooxygenase SsuD/methylene tetrahydromethanopterin reductase-like flavin-dependent oxidoreductase (luciferase family)
MIFDLFNELQRPGPTSRGYERFEFANALAQIQLADQLGYGTWWMVEHHCSPEFSLSSSPEMINAAFAQHTERIHLGHSGVLAPFTINHPLRVAERAAVLDQLSGGRAEIGLARSGGAEWDTFSIVPETTLDELETTARLCVAAWTQDRFSWDSDLLKIPERTLTPRPLQDPHPRLWQTVSTPSSFEMAARLGMGVLATTLLSPISVIEDLLGRYDATIAANPTPMTPRPNRRKAVFTFVHCAESRQAAIDSRAAEAALWYVNAAPKVFSVPRTIWTNKIRGQVRDDRDRARSVADVADVMVDLDPDDPHPIVRLLNRQALGYELDPVETYEVLEPLDSVIIGDVDHCRAKFERYASVGVDQMMCLMQFGHLSHAQAMSSIRCLGEHLVESMATV